MSVKNAKGPLFDPGLCRCCGTMKKCRVLTVEYESFGQKEIYSDMMMDCFGLLLSHLDGKETERLICATCVLRIREAFAFRKQVLRCEEIFLQMKMLDIDSRGIFLATSHTLLRFQMNHIQIEDALVDGAPKVEIELVKTEPEDISSEADSVCGDALADVADDDVKPNMNYDDEDDMPLHRIKPSPVVIRQKVNRPSLPLTRQKVVKNRPTAMDRQKKMLEKKMTDKKVMKTMTVKKPQMPMSEIQQLIRERDPTYISETNILTIVEFSYVCPFKCRHNHLLCYYCGQNFSDPIQLREHTEELHNPRKFKVTEHKNMIKLDLTRVDCRLCGVKINKLDDFKRHISTVHGKKYYFDFKDLVLPFKLSKDEPKCAICDVIFPYFHALNKHMNEHFSNYVCETCGLGFVDKGRFVMHQQRHEEGDFPCETCGKIFKAQYNRELHIDRVHMKKGRVYCPKCDIKLMSYPQKLKHLVEVHGEEPLSFPCNMCDRIFETRRTLTIHRRKDHLKDYRYECQCCGQKFFTRFALNNHMPTHTGERNFKCKVCEKSYPRLKTLKDHMRIHTNDRRYRCHICGQAFIQNCSLKGHMKSQHPEYG